MTMRFAVVGLMLALSASPAWGETIDVLVRRPAVASDAYMLRSMAVERFTGTDGRALAAAIERELANARAPGGAPLFEVFDAGAGEGAFSGRADGDVEESRFMEKRRFCPGTRDRNAKCEDKVKETVEISCRLRVVTFDADIRIVRASDGRLLASKNVPLRDEARWCPGDGNPPEVQSVIARFVSRAAAETVGDLVPYARLTPIRIREDRKGLAKEVSAQFRAAVLATRGDGRDGCAQFEALVPTAGGHSPLIFNLALCAEARGDLPRAIDGYRRVGDRDAAAAAERALASQDAEAQERARAGGKR